MTPTFLDTPVGVPDSSAIESIQMALEHIPHKDIFTLRTNEQEIGVFSRDILLFTIKFKQPLSPSEKPP